MQRSETNQRDPLNDLFPAFRFSILRFYFSVFNRELKRYFDALKSRVRNSAQQFSSLCENPHTLRIKTTESIAVKLLSALAGCLARQL